jgi:Protein of unknown function (DUF2841)
LLPLRMEKRGLSRRFLWHLIVNASSREISTHTTVVLFGKPTQMMHILALVNPTRILMLRSQLTQRRPGYGPDSMYGEIDMDSEQGRKSSGSSEGHRYRKTRSDDSDEEVSSSSRGKKRARYPGWREHSNDDTPIPVPVQKTQQLMIGDSAEVEKFYSCRFKDMQQSSCKVMGKAFVKLVEPKKQTHHPYTKGDGKAPPWWPPTTGDDNVKVRHKEPDHLLKPGR